MGARVEYSEFVYIMLNKPEGYVSATDDKSLPFVTELLDERYRRMELFPVGRLDKDTVGLMILTNDGALAHRVLSPKHHVEKKYYFEADEPLPEGISKEFECGVVLRDGYECKPAKIELLSDGRSGYITLTEGKYHQIKRMIASFDNRVTYLERVAFGKIRLDSALSRGEWRVLTDEEITLLREQNN
jgi:16S rRNA pseudouridine516 synthase